MTLRTNRSSTVAAVAVAASALLLAGCGENGDDEGSVAAPGQGQVATTSEPSSPADDLADGIVEQYTVLAEEIEARGGYSTVGDWKVGFIVEAAEPWFENSGNFREPAEDETHHLEIIPFENSTGRIVPGMSIKLEIIDSTGKVVDSDDLNFYYSTFFHYANNFSVPQEGTYTLKATLNRPTFLRHGEKEDGPALNEGAVVEFRDVKLSPTPAEDGGSGSASGSGSGSGSGSASVPEATSTP